jgi:hypothetical protein
VVLKLTYCTVKKGDRIAQLIIERIATPEIEEVTELDDTERGSGNPKAFVFTDFTQRGIWFNRTEWKQ